MIEGKCHLNSELFHNDFACAVRETPPLIVELLEGLPGTLYISGGDLMYFRQMMMIKEPCT